MQDFSVEKTLLPDQMVEKDGWLRSPEHRPVNRAANVAGSIHDDSTAQRLGFRGGTVAGSVHMDQYPPLLSALWGAAWWETGSLSLSFVEATTSAEPVVAMAEVPYRDRDVQVRVRTERPNGLLVAEGTASVGDPGVDSHLHAIPLRRAETTELRILDGGLEGQPFAEMEAAVPVTGSMGGAPGGAVPPSVLVQYLRQHASFGPHVGAAVGLFGAIELRHWRGPVRFGQVLRLTGRVVALGDSPKTEFAWFDTEATDGGGRPVASMRMQLRWMKGSSPLWADRG